MSRIRSIHPGLWTDEAFVSLSPFARLLAMGIWNECDDKGTFPWSPLQMKMRVLPADNVDAAGLMAELEAQQLICRYEIDGKSYGAVRNFCKFQRPKKPNDIHPITAEIRAFVGMSGEPEEDQDPSVPSEFPTSGEKSPQMEDGGGKGEEKEETGASSLDAPARRAPKRAVKLPTDWEPVLTPAAQRIVDGWPPGKLEAELQRFRDHAADKGRVSKDWQAAFRTWLTKADEWMRRDGHSGQQRAPQPRSGDGSVDYLFNRIQAGGPR